MPETPPTVADNAAAFTWQSDDVFGRIASRYDISRFPVGRSSLQMSAKQCLRSRSVASLLTRRSSCAS
jgi:hypothetical protein